MDPKFKIVSKKNKLKQIASKKRETEDMDFGEDQPPQKQHTITIMTSERKVKLWARSQYLIAQFDESINRHAQGDPLAPAEPVRQLRARQNRRLRAVGWSTGETTCGSCPVP